MNLPITRTSGPAVTDVYTNLQGLNQVKNEENKDEAIRKVAQQFESIFISLMLKNMRSANAVFEEDSLFNSSESDFYRDMHDQQLSLTLAHNKGVGLADALYRQMKQNFDSVGREQIANTEPMPIHSSSREQAYFIKDMQRLHKDVYNNPVSSHAPTNNTQNPRFNIFSEVESFIADTPKQFISTLMPFAKSIADKLGATPEVIVAQAALETGWGKKVISDENGKNSFNLFNIKAGGDWQGATTSIKTLEYREGQFKPEIASFRRYNSISQSFDDYLQFLSQSDRYKAALDNSAKSESEELRSRQFIHGIANAGYATDPRYADKVMDVYKRVVNTVASEKQNEASQSLSSSGRQPSPNRT